jgi:hypothetical protein
MFLQYIEAYSLYCRGIVPRSWSFEYSNPVEQEDSAVRISSTSVLSSFLVVDGAVEWRCHSRFCFAFVRVWIRVKVICCLFHLRLRGFFDRWGPCPTRVFIAPARVSCFFLVRLDVRRPYWRNFFDWSRRGLILDLWQNQRILIVWISLKVNIMSMKEIEFKDLRRDFSMSVLPIKYPTDFPFGCQ